MPGGWPAGGIWLAVEPADMRRSFDGLCGLAAAHLGENPASGRWHVFINRRRTMVRALGFEPGGFFIWAKRLEQGLFASPSGGAASVMTSPWRRRHEDPRRRGIGGQRAAGEQRLLPPRRQLTDPFVRMAVDAQQDVGQPDARTDAPHPAGGEQTVDDPGILGAGSAPGE